MASISQTADPHSSNEGATPGKANSKGLALSHRHQRLKGKRSTWDALNQEISEYVMPRKSLITEQFDEPTTTSNDLLFSNVAIRSNIVLANGMMSWLSPMEEPWFSFEAPHYLKPDDETRAWFANATREVRISLARSNFYTNLHELYLDRGAFGTGLMYSEMGETGIHFEKSDVGYYSIENGANGNIDTVYRDFRRSARQLAKMFGEENLSPATRKMLNDPKKADELIDVVHTVQPRDDSDRQVGKSDSLNKPWASYYWELKNKHILREGGYDDFPYHGSRFLTWGDNAYGWSPSWEALPEMRQLNFLEKNLDALAELQAFPRLLLPDNMEGDVDLRAAGITYYNSGNPGAMPKEWATQGRYDIGVERSDRKKKAIEESYMVDVFQLFRNIDKTMTAREVAERSAEKLLQFSPTFSRMTTEFFNPMFARIWTLHFNAGAFGEPPEGAIVRAGDGQAFLPEPSVAYSSKIALAAQARQTLDLAKHFEIMMPMIQLNPEYLDNYDGDKISRDTAMSDNLPSEWLRPIEQVEGIRAQRAEQAAAAQEAENAQRMADAMQKASTAQAPA